jgi:hypothetical protein
VSATPPPSRAAAVPARASLRRTYESEEMVEALVRALGPDNSGFVHCLASGKELRLEAEAKSVGELRRSLDDALACLSAAERTWLRAHGEPEPEAGESSAASEEDGADES